MLLCLGILCFLVCVVPSYSQVTVVVPNVLRLHAQETVAIAIDSGAPGGEVQVFLQDLPGKKNVFSRIAVQMSPGETKIETVMVTPQNIPDADIVDPEQKHYVALTVQGPGGFNKEATILVSPHSGYLFLQTDKPIYTPRESVHIRIIPLDEDMLTSSDAFKLQIRNPQNIIVENVDYAAGEDRGAGGKSGFVAHTFAIPPHPLMGEWNVVVFHGHKLKMNSTVKFEIKEYVLPTFSVTVSSPNVILPELEVITGQLTAMYVYGKQVEGLVIFKFGVKDKAGNIAYTGRTNSKELVDGQADYIVDTREFKSDGRIPWFPEGYRFVVEATVTDRSTGNREVAMDDSGIFARSPFTISFKNSLRDFKPGLVSLVMADVTYANGRAASEVPTTIEVKDQQGKAVGVNRKDSISDENGRVAFSILSQLPHETLQVTVRTNSAHLLAAQQAVGQHTLTRYQSPGGAYIAISRPDARKIVQVGDHFAATVYSQPAETLTSISYAVVSKGRIVAANQLQRGIFLERKVDFPVTADMSPSARLVIYSVHGGHIYADSLRLDVEDRCKPESEIQIENRYSDIPEPGQDGSIIVKGSQGTHVGLLAVDEAVYVLRNKDRLTRSKLFAAMESHDLGCGPGGGGNANEVVTQAGLIILSNAKDQISKRSDYTCTEKKRRKREIIQEIAHGLEGKARRCCLLGMLPDEQGRTCEIRTDILKTFLGNAENNLECTTAYQLCCQRRRTYFEEPHSEARSTPLDGADGSPESRVRTHVQEADALEFLDEELIEGAEKDVLVRQDFRETWIFEESVVGPDGRATFQANLPHSITTWVVQAVGVSPAIGMCVAEPQPIRTFKKIFLQLNLPYSVVRNEQVDIQATVYNYHQKKLAVVVYMYGVKDLCSLALDGEKSERKRIIVDGNSAETVAFPVVPLAIGQYPIRMVAVSTEGSDVIVKKLHVVAEGMLYEEHITLTLDPENTQRRKERSVNTGKYTDSIDPNQKLQLSIIKLKPSKDFVPGTESCLISAIGDRFGPTVATALSDPEKLLRAPKGCGEQTMIFLAPTLYSLQYLKVTGKVTPEVEQKGYTFVRDGYKRELTFRKPDGSYAAFPNRPPSTWLTAFVMKVFCQASAFINIDENVICSGIKWLVAQQQRDNSFSEGLPVLHREMIGGVNGPVATTAFVLAALQECTCVVEDLPAVRARAEAYLEEKIESTDDPLVVALLAYALGLGNSAARVTANNKLKRLARYDPATNTRCWGDPATPVAVEATSYALLAQLLHNDLEYSNAIVNWLNAQRSNTGAFVSTQDTVVALQALSQYAIQSRSPDIDLLCNVTSSSDRQLAHSLRFRRDNALILQQLELSRMTGSLFFHTSGKGIGLLSVQMRYNVPRPAEKVCKFDVNVTVTEVEDKPEPVQQKIGDEIGNDLFDFPEDLIRTLGIPPDELSRPKHEDPKDSASVKKSKWINRKQDLARSTQRQGFYDNYHRITEQRRKRNALSPEERTRIGGAQKSTHSKLIMQVRICAKYLTDKDSDMAVVDAGIFSGFKPDIDSLKKVLKEPASLISRYEVSNRNVVFYFDKMPHAWTYCFSFRIRREFIVGSTQAAAVKVYDYYKPKDACTEFYSPGPNSPLIRTICEGRVCQCAEGGCPSANPFAGIMREATIPNQRQKLLASACDGINNDYVWKGEVVDNRLLPGGFRYVDFKVTSIFKEGIEPADQVLDQIRRLMVRDTCPTGNLVPGASYIIMGKDSEPFEEKDTGRIYHRYVLDSTTSIHKWTTVREADNKDLQKLLTWLERVLVTQRQGCNQ